MARAAVVYSARANGEIDTALRRWAENRGDRALADALAAALDRLEQFPEIGARVKKRGQWSSTRRYILKAVGYHLYYDFNATREVVLVTCFWHERRRPPRL